MNGCTWNRLDKQCGVNYKAKLIPIAIIKDVVCLANTMVRCFFNYLRWTSNDPRNVHMHITNFMGHNLIIIVVWILFFISLYGIDMNVIHLFVLFEHQCCAHYLNTNVVCLFILFKHECCMSIHVVYTWKLCTWLMCLNNAQHLCLNNTNLWNNKFHTVLERTHEACKYFTNVNRLP